MFKKNDRNQWNLYSLLSFDLAFLLTPFLVFAEPQSLPPLDITQPVTQFAFGSCNKQDRPQPLWKNMMQIQPQPQFFMWMGDAIYGDTSDLTVLKSKFDQQSQQPDYSLLKQQMPIIGVWDDHDYGKNNAGKTWSIKRQVQELYLNFLGEPLTSERRHQEGIYTSYLLGPPHRQIKIILMDSRYFKSDVRDVPADILGEAQWQWLEKELKESRAQAHFLVSSFSMLSKSIFAGEQWVDYSYSWQKLNQLILTYHPKGLIILTGDRHFGGMLQRKMDDGNTYYELMSSGLTHLIPPTLQGLLKKIYGEENSFFALNFGTIKLNWEEQESVLKELSFSLYSDKSQALPAWVKNFKLVQNHWQLQP